METPKKAPKKSAIDSDNTDHESVDSGEKKGTGRRLQDAIAAKNPKRKLNLERRIRGERRVNSDPNYKGPARRYTIDTRQHSKDRRNKD